MLPAPIANFGSGAGIWLIILGALFHMHVLVSVGIVLFAAVVFFQVVNLPVEFDASNRAKAQLVQLGIIDQDELQHVRSVLNAAAWTYVAATLQAVMILLYYILRSQRPGSPQLSARAEGCMSMSSGLSPSCTSSDRPLVSGLR